MDVISENPVNDILLMMVHFQRASESDMANSNERSV